MAKFKNEVIMTDIENDLDNEELDVELRFPVILRNSRIEQSISLEDISKARRLNIKYLEAIESGDIDKLPQPIFTRSYISQFAEFLGIDDDPLVDEYNGYLENFSDEPEIPEVWATKKIEEKNQSKKSLINGLLTLVMLAAITLAAYFIWTQVDISADDLLGESSLEELVATEDVTVEERESVVADMQEEIAVSTLELNLPDSEVAEEAATETDVTKASESVDTSGNINEQLLIQTTAESWVKIRAQGKTVFQGIVNTETPLSINLVKPFWLKIGNANTVAMSYEGEPVELATYTKNDVATFVYQ